jgi:hypothetical protein
MITVFTDQGRSLRLYRTAADAATRNFAAGASV